MRSGVPEVFPCWRDFDAYVQSLIQMGCIDNGKRIWWDIRPHPFFSTLEFRICDIPSTLDDAIALAALCQALIAKLAWLYNHGLRAAVLPSRFIEENKWRAARYGIEGKMIDFGKEAEVPMKELIPELLEMVDDVLDDLGSRGAVEYIHTILHEGTSAERQLRVYKQTGDLKEVVRHLVTETRASVMDTKSSSASTVH